MTGAVLPVFHTPSWCEGGGGVTLNMINHVNTLDNARKIELTCFCLSRGVILNTQQQLGSNMFERNLPVNQAIGSIITILLKMRHGYNIWKEQ
jgi:hypothetical protein